MRPVGPCNECGGWPFTDGRVCPVCKGTGMRVEDADDMGPGDHEDPSPRAEKEQG